MAKKATAARRETATEKAKRLGEELTALRSEIEDLVEENRDELCETGLRDAAERLKPHGVKLKTGRDKLAVHFVVYLNVSGLDGRLTQNFSRAGWKFSTVGVEDDLVTRVTEALDGVAIAGMEIEGDFDSTGFIYNVEYV